MKGMGKGGKIDVYIDCNSPWSFHAYNHFRKHRQALAEHEVDVEFYPVFLGGIMVGSGNKPPWTLSAKAKYLEFDGPRGQRYFGSPKLATPPFFPIMSLLPMRSMIYAKEHYPNGQYEDSLGELWRFLWIEHKDVSKPEVLVECLARHFTRADAEAIVKAGTDPKYKKLLTDQTAWLVGKGAFGAPWIIAKNRAGQEEPFFGSDRFHFLWQFLEIPFRDIEILPPESKSLSGVKL